MPRRQTPVTPIAAGYAAAAAPVALSVVLPSFRAAPVARQSVARLAHALSGRLETYEIIVVDDGAGDCTAAISSMAPGRGATIRVITLPENRGKGAAVAEGMRVATGAVRVFTDIDLPYGTTSIMFMHSLVSERGFHMVIGDRTFPQSRYDLDRPFSRRVAAAAFSRVTNRLITPGFADTQCGIKAFRGDVAEALFALQTVNGFAFDVEIIYMAMKHGLEIKRIPVTLETNVTSSVRVGADSMQAALDIVRIALNGMRGAYTNNHLASLVARECAAGSAPLKTPVISHAAFRAPA